MESLILKPEIVEQIKTDTILQGKIAAELEVSVQSVLRTYCKGNNPGLTQINVLHIIQYHLGIKKVSDLLTEMEAA